MRVRMGLIAALFALGLTGSELAFTAPETSLVTGRVTDASRRPVADCAVDVIRADGVRVAGRTDADGRFAVRLPRRTDPEEIKGTVWVRRRLADGSTTAASATLWFTPQTEHFRVWEDPLVLHPAWSVRIDVRHAGKPVSGAIVTPLLPWNASSSYPLVPAVTDASGAARIYGLPKKVTRVHVQAPGLGPSWLTLAEEFAPFVAKLPAARDINVRVIDAETRAPVVGAKVGASVGSGRGSGLWDAHVLPRSRRTDAQGRVTITEVPADEAVVVWASAPGYDVRRPEVGSDADGEALIELRPHDSEVRIPVSTGSSPLPEGAQLSLWDNGRPVPGTASIEGGRVVLRGLDHGWFYGSIISDSGHFAYVGPRRRRMQSGGSDTTLGRVRFQPMQRIRVQVKDPDGAPVAGLRVRITRDGPVFAAPGGPPQRSSLRTTDDDGTAVWYAAAGDWIRLLADEDFNRSRARLGWIDARRGDVDAEITIGRKARLHLLMTVDGKPGIPASLDIGSGNHRPRILEEDPEAGRLVMDVRFPPGVERLQLSITGDDIVGAYVTLTDEHATHYEHRVEVARRCTLEVEAIGEDWPPNIQVHKQVDGKWEHEANGPRFALLGADDPAVTFRELGPGTYRAVHPDSGTSSPTVTLAPGGSSARVTFDTRASRKIEGTITGPAGVDWDDAWIEAEGVATDLSPYSRSSRPPGRRSRVRQRSKDGAEAQFRFKAPTGVDIPLVIRHPLLRPVGSTARVDAPRKPIELRARARPAFVFMLDQDVRSGDRPGRWRDWLSFNDMHYWWPGEDLGDESVEVSVRAHDAEAWRRVYVKRDGLRGPVRVPLDAGGTYDFRVSARGWEPTVVENVTIGDPPDDALPAVSQTVALARGRALRVRFKLRETDRVIRAWAWVTTEGADPVVRGWTVQRENEVVVKGIPRGAAGVRLGLQVEAADGRETRELQRTIEFGDTPDVVLEVDVGDMKLEMRR